MKNISSVLKSVQKPGQYVGGEYNAIMKNKESIKCRFAFCFPDTYEIGMSNLGVRILYDVLNKDEDIWCERVYAPWTDMKAAMESLFYGGHKTKVIGCNARERNHRHFAPIHIMPQPSPQWRL